MKDVTTLAKTKATREGQHVDALDVRAGGTLRDQERFVWPFKTDGHMGRNFLKGRDGDRANAVLTTAIGHNPSEVS